MLSNPVPDQSSNTIIGSNSKPDIMSDEFRTRIKSLPLVIQYLFIELFSKYYNEHFTHNTIITRSIFQFNTMDLSGSDDEFKKRIITSGLKILSEELCPIFVASNAKHAHPKIHCDVMTQDEITSSQIHKTNTSFSKLSNYAINCDALNTYFRIIRELIQTLDIKTIKDILLDDFVQYQHTHTVVSNQVAEHVTVEYLYNTVFDDMDNLHLELVKVIDEQRFDCFEVCLGTIVLMAENKDRGDCFYLIFDVLTKKIFKYDYDSCYNYSGKMRTDDFVIKLEDWDEDEDEDKVEDKVNKPSTSTNTVTSQSQTQSSNNFFTNALFMCILFTIIIPILVVCLILSFWLYNGIRDFFDIFRVVTDAISEPKFSSLG